MELPGKRKRGRPKRRFMDVLKEDMAEVEMTKEDTVDRNNRRRKIRCGDPLWPSLFTPLWPSQFTPQQIIYSVPLIGKKNRGWYCGVSVTQ